MSIKKLLILIALIFIAPSAWASHTSPLSPGTAANSNTAGTKAWADVDYIKISDTSYASTSGTGVQDSQYLKSTNYGFSIPASSTINGVVYEIRAKGTNIASYHYLMKNNTVNTSVKKQDATSVWTSTPAYITYGSSTDLWGDTWSVEDINNSGFGVATRVFPGLNQPFVANADHTRITVYYTTPSISNLIDSYDEGHFLGNLSLGRDPDEPFGGYYQTFIPTFNSTLTDAKFYLRKVGSPTGTAVAYVFRTTGICGSTGVPTSSPIATSNVYSVSSLTTTNQLIDFTFQTPITLTKNTCYTVGVKYETGDNSNYLGFGVADAYDAHSGNLSYNEIGSALYNEAGDYDAIFYVYGTPLPPPAQFLSSVQLKGNTIIK